MPLAQPPDNATPEQIAKTEQVRLKMLRLARDRYLFRVQDRRLTTGLVVENGRLVGLKVAETKMEGRKAEPIPGSEHEIRAPLVISSIGSVPEMLPGVAMNGEYYTFTDEDLPRYTGCEHVFGVGNVVTGQGNIRVSLVHSQKVTTHLIENYLGVGNRDGYLSGLYKPAESRIEGQTQAIEEQIRPTSASGTATALFPGCTSPPNRGSRGRHRPSRNRSKSCRHSFRAIEKCMRLALATLATGAKETATTAPAIDSRHICRTLKERIAEAELVVVTPKQKVTEEQARARQKADGFKINGEIYVKPDRFKRWFPTNLSAPHSRRKRSSSPSGGYRDRRKIGGIKGKPRYYAIRRSRFAPIGIRVIQGCGKLLQKRHQRSWSRNDPRSRRTG